MSNLIERSLVTKLEEKIRNGSIYSERKNELIPFGPTERNLTTEHKELIHYAMNRETRTAKFKMKHFIGDAQITPFAKLRQFLVELREREEFVTTMTYDIRKLEVELKIAKKKYEEEIDELQKELLAIEVDRKERGILVSKKRLDDIYKERQDFLALIDEFNSSEEGKLPDGRLIMEVLGDPEIEEYFEKQLWTERLAKQSAIDIATTGRIGHGNLEAVTQLGPEQQVEVLTLAVDYGTRVATTMNLLGNAANEKLRLNYENKNIQLENFLKLTNKIDTSNLLEHKEEKLNVHSLAT